MHNPSTDPTYNAAMRQGPRIQRLQLMIYNHHWCTLTKDCTANCLEDEPNQSTAPCFFFFVSCALVPPASRPRIRRRPHNRDCTFTYYGASARSVEICGPFETTSNGRTDRRIGGWSVCKLFETVALRLRSGISTVKMNVVSKYT
jgi:hypothetical protein